MGHNSEENEIRCAEECGVEMAISCCPLSIHGVFVGG